MVWLMKHSEAPAGIWVEMEKFFPVGVSGVGPSGTNPVSGSGRVWTEIDFEVLTSRWSKLITADLNSEWNNLQQLDDNQKMASWEYSKKHHCKLVIDRPYPDSFGISFVYIKVTPQKRIKLDLWVVSATILC